MRLPAPPFERLSPAVNRIAKGAVGRLAKAGNDQTITAMNRLFSAETLGVQGVRRARKAITAADPQAWQELKAGWLQHMSEGINDVTGNAPKAFRKKVYGTGRQKKVMKEVFEAGRSLSSSTRS